MTEETAPVRTWRLHTDLQLTEVEAENARDLIDAALKLADIHATWVLTAP